MNLLCPHIDLYVYHSSSQLCICIFTFRDVSVLEFRFVIACKSSFASIGSILSGHQNSEENYPVALLPA